MNNSSKQVYKNGEELFGVVDEILTTCPKLNYEKTGYVEAQSQVELLKYHPEVVLYCPQIPQNTGSISRLCAAFSTTLHLIEPMAFKITEKAVRRAGLDYWEFVDLYIHKSYEEFKKVRSNRRFLFIETGGTQNPNDFQFMPGDCLIFGAETFGIHNEIMEKEIEQGHAQKLTIPMFNRGVRSINLANTVSIVLNLAVSKLHSNNTLK